MKKMTKYTVKQGKVTRKERAFLTPGAPAPWAPPGYGWYCCCPGYVTLAGCLLRNHSRQNLRSLAVHLAVRLVEDIRQQHLLRPSSMRAVRPHVSPNYDESAGHGGAAKQSYLHPCSVLRRRDLGTKDRESSKADLRV
jgi:hypothetical protein